MIVDISGTRIGCLSCWSSTIYRSELFGHFLQMFNHVDKAFHSLIQKVSVFYQCGLLLKLPISQVITPMQIREKWGDGHLPHTEQYKRSISIMKETIHQSIKGEGLNNKIFVQNCQSDDLNTFGTSPISLGSDFHKQQ